MITKAANELARLHALLRAAQGGPAQILDLIPQLTPGFERPTHLMPIVRVFDRLDRGETVHAAISVGPRMSKTETILHGCTYLLRRHPTMTIFYASHGADLAEEKSARCQELAIRAGVQMRRSRQPASRWHTAQGGGMLAVGTGGSIIGRGCQLLVVDDAHRDRAAADSPTQSQAVIDWFRGAAATRLEPGGSSLVVSTRWNSSDLLATITSDDAELKFESIALNAITTTGESIWPSRWSLDELAKRRKIVGEFEWAAQYENSPRPRGTMGIYTPTPERFEYPDFKGASIVCAVDPAASARTRADFSVAVVLACKGSGDDATADVVDCFRAQVEIPELVRRLRVLAHKWWCPFFVESVGGFKSIAQILRDVDPRLRVHETHPRGDKFSRAIPCGAAYSRGAIRLPSATSPSFGPWVPQLIQECASFTGSSADAHDDVPDALATAWTAWQEHSATAHRQLGDFLDDSPEFG